MSSVSLDDDNVHRAGPNDHKQHHNRNPKSPHGHHHDKQRKHNNNRNGRFHKRKFNEVMVSKPTCGVCGLQDGSVRPETTLETKTTSITTSGVVEVKYKCPKCMTPYCSVVCYRQHKEVCPGKKETNDVPKSKDGQAGMDNNDKNEHKKDNDYQHDDDISSDDESLAEGWKVTDDMKVSLKNSTWLRKQLQDGGLRAMISDIVLAEKNYKRQQLKMDRKRRLQQYPKLGGRKKDRDTSIRRNYRHHHNESVVESGESVLSTKRQENPNFDVFVDKIMILAGLLERQDESHCDDNNRSINNGSNGSNINASFHRGGCDLNHEPLDKWLERSWVDTTTTTNKNISGTGSRYTTDAAYRLLLDNSIERPNLTLKPIPKKRKTLPEFQPVDMSSSSEEDDDDNDDEDNSDGDCDDDDDDESSESSDSNAGPDEGGKEEGDVDGSSSGAASCDNDEEG